MSFSAGLSHNEKALVSQMRSAAKGREALPETHVQEEKLMRTNDQLHHDPIQVEKSVRADEIRTLTSARAGKVVPVAFAPLLREDRVSRASIRLSFEMEETVRTLMNAVNVTAYAHFIPYMAFDRLKWGMDTFDRAYSEIAEPSGNLVPFFQTVQFDANAPFWRTMGVHWPAELDINGAPLEAYNVLVNHRRAVRSEHLPVRGRYDTSLAAAFWKNPRFAHIVPDFDAALMDGEVPLSVNLTSTASRLPVQGLQATRLYDGDPGAWAPAATSGGQLWREAAGIGGGAMPNEEIGIRLRGRDVDTRFQPELYVELPEIFEELSQQGIMLSLSNIELAKKTVAFAKLRDRFTGMDEDHLIDLLMDGIRVPDEALKNPMLLARESTIFGYTEHRAMDGANLDMTRTVGKTELTLNFRLPEMNTGGIILITAEIVPEQLFERQRDQFLALNSPSDLPQFVRDFLDPEKVDVVQNGDVDVLHNDADGVFGYEPLNSRWKRSISHVGGRYYRPADDTFIEDRQRFWSPEATNPRLNSDFYLCPDDLPHSVFADTLSEPFEILALGRIEIVGNTVFGKALYEDDGHYDHVFEKVDRTKIIQDSQSGPVTSGPPETAPGGDI